MLHHRISLDNVFIRSCSTSSNKAWSLQAAVSECRNSRLASAAWCDEHRRQVGLGWHGFHDQGTEFQIAQRVL